MDWRRWTWRFVVALPAVALVGLLGPGAANADPASAADPVPCPSPTPLPVIGTVCQTAQQATGTGSTGSAQQVVQNLSNAVTSATGSSGGSASSGQPSSGGTSAASGSAGAGHGAQPSANGATTSAAAVGSTPATAGLLSPLGVPGLLLTGEPEALSPQPVRLNFPEARHAAARSAQASGTAARRLWLLALIGVVGLASVAAGAGGHFAGGLRSRFRTRTTT